MWCILPPLLSLLIYINHYVVNTTRTSDDVLLVLILLAPSLFCRYSYILMTAILTPSKIGITLFHATNTAAN